MSATKVDASEQVKFLVACIKHTDGGKIDFAKVAEELEIVTKAAAAKRYERLLKTYNVSKNGGSITPASPPADGDEPATPAPKSTGGKKRGAKAAAIDGEEGTPTKKKRTPAKKAVKKETAEDEDDEQEEAEPKSPVKKTPAKKAPVKKTPAKRAPKKAAAIKEMPSDEDETVAEDEVEDSAKDGSKSPALSDSPVEDDKKDETEEKEVADKEDIADKEVIKEEQDDDEA